MSACVLGILAVAPAVVTAKSTIELEHCYGIVKAHQNDCTTSVSKCAGSSTRCLY